MTRRILALSRQRGSGGSYVGRAVAERLSLRYIDREMLRHAAEYICAHDLEQQIEAPGIEPVGSSSWWSQVGLAFGLGGPDSGYVPPSSEAVYEGELFEIEKRLMLEIVAEQVAVIVGRGAAQTLRGRAGVVSVFLHAPERWRIDRVQNVYGIADARAARRMVNDSDRDRAKFIHAISGAEWTDVRGYDLAVDTAAVGFDAAVDLIVGAVEARAPDRLS